MTSSPAVGSGSGDESLAQDSAYLSENSFVPGAVAPLPLSPKSHGSPRAPTPAFEDGTILLGSQGPSAASFSVQPAGSSVSDSPHLPKTLMPLPDPSHFPDPYPFRLPHLSQNTPALSSAGSSSARSSAYASSRSPIPSGDYGHVHVASGEDESAVGIGITSDTVVQLLANDGKLPPSLHPTQSRVPIDQTRWSESYSTLRSRSSSLGNGLSQSGIDSVRPGLRQRPSYDTGWQGVDEKEEVGMSEDETDDEQILGEGEDEDEGGEEERTSAAVIAEEGRGQIVHGDDMPIAHLHVQPGTTHLLIRSSSTPNAMPAFLTTTLPQICNTLLALDISANFLGALPPVLAVCQNLEELNIAFNPLRVLPVFLADLTNLRVLIADSTGITTLPETLVDLDKLHTISIRKNKFHALPSWFCLLPNLQTLCVDGNPFQGPWKALVDPLLSKVPPSSIYTPPPSSLPAPSPVIRELLTSDAETDNTDVEDFSDSVPSSGRPDGQYEDEDNTITVDRAPLGRSVMLPLPLNPPIPLQVRGLTRTRTTPNRTHYDQSREPKLNLLPEGRSQQDPPPKQQDTFAVPGNRELRKMKSAGDLRRGKSTAATSGESSISPPRKPLGRSPASVSSLNLLNPTAEQKSPIMNKRFATLGPNSTIGGGFSHNEMRPQLTQSLWDGIPENADGNVPPFPSRVSSLHYNVPSPSKSTASDSQDGKHLSRIQSSRDAKDKGGRWGFLKKMSMGKIKLDSPPPPLPQTRMGPSPRINASAGPSSPAAATSPTSPSVDRIGKLPQIDLRFSTAGILESFNPPLSAPISSTEPRTNQQSIEDPSKSPPGSSSLLSPSQPRSAKRRSFLPLDAPGNLSLTIPSEFPSSILPINGKDESDALNASTPSPPGDTDAYLRRDDDRVREAYTRALRSVMAYLKDMDDLGLSQQSNPMSIYGAATDDVLTTRSRRPTMVDGGHRDSSVTSTSSPVSGELNGQLRSTESIAGLRSGGSTQTLSVVTTDSNGSADERKFKDDRGKRAMIVREIVVTERTYVKGLQELVDIYIKPASVTVNILSGSGKETVVPAPERKIVFGGIDALFSFHKDSFLPALEVAAAPLMKATDQLQQDDAYGQLSLTVVKAVGSMFLKHAAFMKMYSSYINNFDNSVQRVKYWSSDRNAPGNSSPATSALTPSSSTAQLVGLGLSMSSVTAPGLLAEGSVTTGIPPLTTSQRKRIRAYLKRSRLSPRHSQLNLEGYLLLPVQRIPRYRLLLEELLRCTPPTSEYIDDPLDRALAEISSLANNMNEGKRESESRRKLVQWQSRIRGKFPSPLVQPHRRLIMDGPLLLTRVVRKAMVSFEAINAQGDASTVQVDCLAPELTPRTLVGILCNDLLVLCRDPSEGKDPNSSVDLWAVLRMQTLPQPASIVYGNALRLVDNKAILYFDAPSPSDALNWYRAINLHIPASKA